MNDVGGLLPEHPCVDGFRAPRTEERAATALGYPTAYSLTETGVLLPGLTLNIAGDPRRSAACQPVLSVTFRLPSRRPTPSLPTPCRRWPSGSPTPAPFHLRCFHPSTVAESAVCRRTRTPDNRSQLRHPASGQGHPSQRASLFPGLGILLVLAARLDRRSRRG